MFAAAEWYEQRRVGLGDEFLDEVQSGLERLAEAAPRCTLAPGVSATLQVKHFLIQRFPYALVFVEFGPAIRVIAVAHTRRRPGYWKLRLR